MTISNSNSWFQGRIYNIGLPEYEDVEPQINPDIINWSVKIIINIKKVAYQILWTVISVFHLVKIHTLASRAT
jgi:hypothetical protein